MQNNTVTTEMDCEESIALQVPNATQQQTEPEENPSKPSQSEQVPMQDDTIGELPVEHKKIVEIVIGTSGGESSASKASKKQKPKATSTHRKLLSPQEEANLHQ